MNIYQQSKYPESKEVTMPSGPLACEYGVATDAPVAQGAFAEWVGGRALPSLDFALAADEGFEQTPEADQPQ